MKLIEDKENYDISQKRKLRIIDPTVKNNNILCKVSQLLDKVKSLNNQGIKITNEGIYLKILF